MGQRERAGAVEKVDDHTVRLNFSKPILSVPENFYNYPTAILHGTSRKMARICPRTDRNGPYTLAEFAVGQKCILKRTDMPYWGKDIDDPYMMGPIYLDEIHYYDHGAASTAQLAAFASGQVDSIYEFDIASYAMASSIPNSMIYEAQTAQTGTLRMQVTQKPFNDQRVRRAIQLCCDPAAYPELVYQGRGTAGEHHHVSPVHPEYFALPPLKPDIEQAKKLLAEAGHADGLEISIDCGNTNGPWQQQVCEIFQGQLDAGRDQAQHQHHAVDPILGDLGPDAVRDYCLDPSAAGHHGPVGGLSHRRALERDPARPARSSTRRSTSPKGWSTSSSAGRPWRRSRRSSRTTAVLVQPLWQPKFFIASNKVRRHEGASDPVPSVPSRLDHRLTRTNSGRPGHASPVRSPPPEVEVRC